MTIKQHGGIFGRNPTFNDVDVDGTLSVGGTALPTPSNIAKLDTAQEFTQEQEIKISDITAYDATAADAQVTVGPTLFLNNPTNNNTTVGGQVVFGLRSTPYYARIGATGGSIPKIFVGIGTSEIARFTSDGITFNGDTAAANALDDYEEGTWTPEIKVGNTGSAIGITAYEATYTKVGRLVFVEFRIGRNDASSLSGNVTWNLPFASGNATYFPSGSFWNDNTGVSGFVNVNSYANAICNGRTVGGSQLTFADYANGQSLVVSLVYQST